MKMRRIIKKRTTKKDKRRRRASPSPKLEVRRQDHLSIEETESSAKQVPGNQDTAMATEATASLTKLSPNTFDTVNGKPPTIDTLLAETVKSRSFVTFLLACDMLLFPLRAKATDNTVDAAQYSLSETAVADLAHLMRQSEDSSSREQLRSKALASLFSNVTGRLASVAVLSGAVQVLDRSSKFVVRGTSTFGTCALTGYNMQHVADHDSAVIDGEHTGKWYYEVKIATFNKQHFCQVRANNHIDCIV